MLNRIDEIIVFNRLSQEDVRQIASLFLDQLAERVRELHMEITFDPSVLDFVVRRGYDPVNGARHLRRTVTHDIEDRLSEAMLSRRIQSGMRIKVAAVNDRVIVEENVSNRTQTNIST